MQYRALTVAREFGSGGAELARLLANQLGWNLLDNALVMQIAQAAHVEPALARQYDERVDSWLHRVTRSSLWSGAFEAVAEPADLAVFDSETMAAIATQLIREAHSQGNCVIVGRGAQCVLRQHDDAFHLFVYAPWKARLDRIRTRPGAPPDLDAWIKQLDSCRAQYVKHNFGCEWSNPHLYNLMIDSALGQEAAAAAVLAAMRANPGAD
jgi:cytidylate kinase